MKVKPTKTLTIILLLLLSFSLVATLLKNPQVSATTGTFGKTTIGGSSFDWTGGLEAYGWMNSYPLSEDGSVTQISIYVAADSGTISMKTAIYDSSGDLVVVSNETTEIDTTPKWINFSVTPTDLSAGDYYLAYTASGGSYTVAWDSGSCGLINAAYSFPSSVSYSGFNGVDTSIYATYTIGPLSTSSPTPTSTPSPPGASDMTLHVTGNSLYFENDSVMTLRGVDYSYFTDSPPGSWINQAGMVEWNTFDTTAIQDNLDAMKAWGANIVRTPLTVSYWIDDTDNMRSNLVDWINYAGNRSMYVEVVFWRCNATDTEPAGFLPWNDAGNGYINNIADFTYLWGNVSDALKSYQNVLFELWNEPNGGTASEYMGAAQLALDAIRATGATNPVVVQYEYGVGTDIGSGYVINMDWVTDYPLTDTTGNLVYSAHIYRNAFTNTTAPSHQLYTEAEMDYALTAVGLYDIAASYPVYIGEIGCSLWSGDQVAEQAWFNNTLTFLESHGISYSVWWWWCTGNQWGLYTSGAVTPFAPNYESNTSGDILKAHLLGSSPTPSPSTSPSPSISPIPSSSPTIAPVVTGIPLPSGYGFGPTDLFDLSLATGEGFNIQDTYHNNSFIYFTVSSGSLQGNATLTFDTTGGTLYVNPATSGTLSVTSNGTNFNSYFNGALMTGATAFTDPPFTITWTWTPTSVTPIIVGSGNQTLYFRSDNFITNTVSAFGLDPQNTFAATTVTDTSAGDVSVAYGFRVWLVHPTGTMTELTSGTPVAVLTRTTDGSGFQTATWTPGETALSIGYNALYVTIYESLDGASYVAKANYVTHDLVNTMLLHQTWTFRLWTSKTTTTSTTATFKFGDNTYNSDITGVGFAVPSLFEVELYLLMTGNLIGFLFYGYGVAFGSIANFCIFLAMAIYGSIYIRYRSLAPILFIFVLFGGAMTSIAWFLIPVWAAAIVDVILVLAFLFLIWKVIR